VPINVPQAAKLIKEVKKKAIDAMIFILNNITLKEQ
jgi:hypothetical protein